MSGLKGDPIILTADRDYHGYIRKLLAHGFSEKSLREQEPVLKQYVDTMFDRLHEESKDGQQAIDVGRWYNVSCCPPVQSTTASWPNGIQYLTFDFISLLSQSPLKITLQALLHER
jgi:hypothetical protein